MRGTARHGTDGGQARAVAGAGMALQRRAMGDKFRCHAKSSSREGVSIVRTGRSTVAERRI